MPDVLPGTIKMIALTGGLNPVTREDNVSLLLKAKGADYFDTIPIGQSVKIENLNPDYFKYTKDGNVLRGKILVNNMTLKNLVFEGTLSFIYQK